MVPPADRELPPEPLLDETLVAGVDPPRRLVEERVVVEDGAVYQPGPPLLGDSVEEEIAPGIVRESEQVAVGEDGVVRRRYERVEQPPLTRRRVRPGLVWPLAALLVLVVAGGILWWALSRGPDRAAVPAVTGVPLATAVDRLSARGLRVQVANVPNAQPRGTVFGQRPAAETRVDKGSAVRLEVSSGSSTVVVPNAVGLSEPDARDRAVSAGFVVTAVDVLSSRPPGTVVAQAPAAGSRAAHGSGLRLNVSRGTGEVIVPNVVGQQVGAAETALAQAGLRGAVQFHVASSQPVGTVVAQSPPGGKVRTGSTVQLNVSRGPR